MQNIPGRDESNQKNIPPQGLSTLCTAPEGSSYTDSEWKTLVITPLQVGKAMIVVSPSGTIGTVQEVRALNNVMATAMSQNATNPLLRMLGQSLQRVVDMGTSGQINQVKESLMGQDIDADTARTTALNNSQQAVAILKKASPQDAMAYKEMLYTVARTVAEAAREGGFLGIAGGEIISKPEQNLLNELASTLGIQRQRS